MTILIVILIVIMLAVLFGMFLIFKELAMIRKQSKLQNDFNIAVGDLNQSMGKNITLLNKTAMAWHLDNASKGGKRG